MKKISVAFSVILLCGLILSACGPRPQPQPAAPQPAATEPPAAAPQATEAPTTAPAAPPANPPAPAQPQHANVPGELPGGKPAVVADYSPAYSGSNKLATVGDVFSKGKYERPYNANTMDTYFQYLDISNADFYDSDPMWFYGVIHMVGTDTNNALPAKYALELDLNLDGRGDLLVLVDHPASTSWDTQGVQAFTDPDSDVGGDKPVNADSGGANGDGYESVIFDQGNGSDPDAAWARVDPNDPKSVEFAFKKELLNGRTKFLVGAWAGTSALDPAKFDFNDHMTSEQAGAAYEPFSTYPIKGLAELDNTCRRAIGFTPSVALLGACE